MTNRNIKKQIRAFSRGENKNKITNSNRKSEKLAKEKKKNS